MTVGSSVTLICLLVVARFAGSLATNVSNHSPASQHFAKIPGLYELDQLVTPIQGDDQFQDLVLSPQANKTGLARFEETLHLVQFYMATCPDCQGFSPYFKRFVQSVAPHWRRLVRIGVVNCNDQNNIHLCWGQNPRLTVPLVRWYTFPSLIYDATKDRQNRNYSNYPIHLLNVAHRDYIEKQRRDLISLRHATLRFIGSILAQMGPNNNRLATTGDKDSLDNLYRRLPLHWHLLVSLDRSQNRNTSDSPLPANLLMRQETCMQATNQTIDHFLVLERRQSFLGKTLVADWSNWTDCSLESYSLSGSPKRAFLVHFSNDFSVLRKVPVENLPELDQSRALADEPLLFKLTIGESKRLEDLRLTLLASNSSTLSRTKRDAVHEASRLERLNQRLSLEKYYTRRRSLDAADHYRHPFRYGASMTSGGDTAGGGTGRRRIRSVEQSNATQMADYSKLENINWAPADLYGDEETLRFAFNREIALLVYQDAQALGPGASSHPGELAKPYSSGDKQAVSAIQEDTSLLRLTDYYKVLDEIVHHNILSRAQLDGYQMLGITCWLRLLSKRFPFQGILSRLGSTRSSRYLELQSLELDRQLGNQLNASTKTDWCSSPVQLNDSRLANLRFPSQELQKLQQQLVGQHQIGLPEEAHFKWSYCAGSAEYLRGHTCSLWILFHTLTVHEYLQQPEMQTNQTEAYEFKVKAEPAKGKASCDPANPEPALLNATAGALYQPEVHLALANVINFVRNHLACTNCAAHFSCMVQRSQLVWEHPRPGDHLLWLWEAHNRVNLRTRRTHSEDPLHPKHVFPVYEACESCYLHKPSGNETELEEFTFSRQALVEFLLARYRSSAILNNKIHIEDLIGKPVKSSTG